MGLVVPVRMYDTVNPDNIPADAEVVAGYVDGDYAWPAEAWRRWPDAVKVLISAIPGSEESGFANVADCENGDYSPGEARDFIAGHQKAGRHGSTVYVSRDSWPSVITACRGLAYFPWVADWTNEPHQLPGAALVQYEGGDVVDLSTVYSQVWLDLVDAANRPWPL